MMAERHCAINDTDVIDQHSSQSNNEIKTDNLANNVDDDNSIQVCVINNKPKLFCRLKPRSQNGTKKHHRVATFKKPTNGIRKKESVNSFIKRKKQSRDKRMLEARSIRTQFSPTSDFERDLNVKLSMIMKKFVDSKGAVQNKSKSAPVRKYAKSKTALSAKGKMKSLNVCLLKDRPKVIKRSLKDTKSARKCTEQRSSGCCFFDAIKSKLGLVCEPGDPAINGKTENKKRNSLRANAVSHSSKAKSKLSKSKKRACCRKTTLRKMTMKILNKVEKKELVVTLDTNILINHLDFVRRLLGRELPGYGAPRVVLPWTVLQELDHIKDSRKRGRYRADTVAAAARAIRLIHERLGDKASRLVGQSPTQAYRVEAAGGISVMNNDDRILASVIQERKKSPKNRLVLLTEDVNLANKSHVAGITAADTKTFFKKLNLREVGCKSFKIV